MRDRLLWASTAVVPFVFGLATIALQRASGVTMFDDELGFLGEAVHFSTRDSADPLLAGIPFYSSGYPALLALPLSVTPFDPWTVAVATNVVLLAALGPVLHSLVRRLLGLEGVAAAAVAIAGATAPSVVFQTPRAWAEVCTALIFTVWAWLLLRYSRRGPAVGAIPLAIASGAMLGVHRRASAVVVLTLAAIAVCSLLPLLRGGGPLRARSGGVPWRTFVLAEVAGLATSAAALALDAHVVDRLYDGRTSGSRLDKAENLLSTAWIPAALGHVWSLLATTFVLAGVGALYLLWSVRRGRDAVFATVLLLAVAGVAATSVLFLANGIRADQLVYERYTGATAPVLVALGAGALARRLAPVRWWLLGAAGALLASGAALSISLQDSRLTGNVHKYTTPTLTSLDMVVTGWGEPFTDGIHVLPITAVVLVAVAIIAATAAWRLWLGPAAVVAACGVTVATGSAGNLRPFVDQWEPTGRAAADLLRDADVAVLQYSPHLRHESRNVLHYRLGYPDVQLTDPPSCEVSPYTVGPPELADDQGLAGVVEVGLFPGVVYDLGC